MPGRNVKLLMYAGGFAPVGGVQSFMRDLAVAVHGRGVDIRLICWGPTGDLIRSVIEAGVPVTRRIWRWGCRWGWPDRLLLRAGKAALRWADVVLFGHLQPCAQREVIQLKAQTGKPKAVLVTPYRPAEMWDARRPSTEILNSFDVIVAQGCLFAADLRAFGYQGNIKLLPYLPLPCEPIAPLPQGQLRVGFLGRLVPDKNLSYLLRAFGLLRGRLPCTLHLFGEGHERRSLEGLAASLGVKDSISFHGLVRREEVPRAVDSCHLFAFTSVTEGLPVAALEILARGRPVVATPVGVFPELLSDGTLGALAPLADAEAFAAVLENTARRGFEGLLTPQRVQSAYQARFPREVILNEYVKLFRELAGQAPTNVAK